MQLLEGVFSVWGFLIALMLTSAGWWWARGRIQRNRDMDAVVTTLLPILALVISAFSYGAQAVSSEAQSAFLSQHIEAMRNQLAAHRDQNEILRAEFRGLLTFHAEYDEDWNVILTKLDGRPFEVDDLRLIANYQVDRNEGPIDGVPIPALPIPNRTDGEWAIQVGSALDLVCSTERSLCDGTARIRMLTLEFTHDGVAHRVVALPR